MKEIRKILAVLSVVLIALILMFMDYNDLSWSTNKKNYLGILACVLNVWALIFLFREKKS